MCGGDIDSQHTEWLGEYSSVRQMGLGVGSAVVSVTHSHRRPSSVRSNESERRRDATGDGVTVIHCILLQLR